MAGEKGTHYTVVFVLEDWKKFAEGTLGSLMDMHMGKKPTDGAMPVSFAHGNANDWEDYSNFLLASWEKHVDHSEVLNFDEWVKAGKPEFHDENEDYDGADNL